MIWGYIFISLKWERDSYYLSVYYYNYYFIIIIIWLLWVFVAVRRLSVVEATRGYSSLQCAGFSLWWLLLSRSMGSGHAGFSSCGTQVQ